MPTEEEGRFLGTV